MVLLRHFGTGADAELDSKLPHQKEYFIFPESQVAVLKPSLTSGLLRPHNLATIIIVILGHDGHVLADFVP